ncbi:MAG: sulfatase [Actinomycetota bacterium]|nr:sulfatase [Actinomycetota bacterium]
MGAVRVPVLAATLAIAVGSVALLAGTRQAESATGDNVIFILTDDQTTSELAAMPNVRALIGGAGATFNRAYVPYPLCCPSRASLLSGQYMHNHGVHGNVEPNGGWQAFRPREPSALPVRTHTAGYYNVQVGKYMNGYVATGSPPYVPPGWDEWFGKISEENLYFNYTLLEQTAPLDTPEVAFYGDQPDEYQTDVFGDKAVDFVAGLTGAQTPFMLNLWFNAPHSPFEPAPRHLGSFATSKLPKLPGFNEKDISDKPRWLRKQAKRRLGKGIRNTIEAERRRRLEQLRSVDEAVGLLVSYLRAGGHLDDTYIVFASDNGFFRGEHRIAGGKFLAYEPSARVPLMIRGPGIPAGVVSDELVSELDITQTILEIANGSTVPGLDGRSLLPYAKDPALRSTRPILLEADTGPGLGNAVDTESAGTAAVARARLAGKKGVRDLDQELMANKSAANGSSAPAYKAIRTDRYLYVLYANGQRELYDMRRDPAQLRSKHDDSRYRAVRRWLSRQLFALSTCAGAACRVELGPDPRPRKGKPDKDKGPANDPHGPRPKKPKKP